MSTFPDDPRDESAEPVAGSIPLTGHVVLDDQHQKVGTVSDVLYDERGAAHWAVVDPGPMRAEKFVPVEGAVVTDDGQVVVPYAKDHVKAAPKVARDHVLPHDLERELEEHYELPH